MTSIHSTDVHKYNHMRISMTLLCLKSVEPEGTPGTVDLVLVKEFQARLETRGREKVGGGGR